MDNPEPTEPEHEQAGSERHDEEEAMRYPQDQDPTRTVGDDEE